MSDLSALNQDSGRSVATDAHRTDAAGADGTPASQGRKGGKALPPDAGAAVRERVEKHRAALEQRVQRAVTQLNDYVQSFQRDLEFFVDDELGRAVVQVIDSNTRQVIRQIPSDVALRLARNLNALQEQTLARQATAGGSGGRLGLINTRT